MSLSFGQPRPRRRPNLTPMIDVVFLLLVFFLVATTFATDEVELDLDLPRSQSGRTGDDSLPLVINVRDDGSITVDGRPFGAEALRQRLRAAAAANRERTVVIRGDTRVQYGAVVLALDACLAADLHRVSLAATPDGAGGGR